MVVVVAAALVVVASVFVVAMVAGGAPAWLDEPPQPAAREISSTAGRSNTLVMLRVLRRNLISA